MSLESPFPKKVTVESSETSESPAALSAGLMKVYENMNDFGQPTNAEEAKKIREAVSNADESTQEALAEKFHTETIMSNFNSMSMQKMLGVYRFFPVGPFHDKLKEIESARLKSEGFGELA